MLVRLVSFFLIMLTIGFFYYVHHINNLRPPSSIERVFFPHDTETKIALNEYLILMEDGEKEKLPQVLARFNLKVIEPLGEWVLVASMDAAHEQRIIPLNTPAAQENKVIAAHIEAHPSVHTAYLNYVQSDDSACLSCMREPREEESRDDSIVPRDPMFPLQWHLSKEKGIHLPQAWAITTGNPAIVLGIVDRNFSFTDPDMDPKLCSSRQYYYENVLDYTPQKKTRAANDNRAHGLDVLNVLAPCTDNGLGLAGIDWHAQVFLVDTLGDRTLAARMFGILWAAGFDVCTSSIASCPEGSSFQRNRHAATIINASFGFSGPYLDDPPYGPVLDVIGRINREGRILVASIGNEESLADRRLPGSAGGVISVGSSNKERKSSNFNNFGRTVDILAPGEQIFGMVKGRASSLSGTSFATPIVTGVVSLMASVNPELSWKQVEYILKTTATPLSCDSYCPNTMKESAKKECRDLCCVKDRSICASGIIDAAKAVAMAQAGIPKTALIDFDDYYLPLSSLNDLRMKVVVKNWGSETALVRMKKTNDYLKIYPENFSLGPLKDGIPSTKEIMLYYDHVAAKPLVLSLVLEAASLAKPTQFDDRIEAIVEIVPDEGGIKTYQELGH